MKTRKSCLSACICFARRFAFNRWLVLGVLLAIPSGIALATTLVPSSYTTTSGTDSGAPVSNIQVLDQSGLGNNPAKQVTFMTSPGVTYAGHRTYNLPSGTSPSTLATMQLVANYQGPAKATQSWTWQIFDWVHQGYVSLGDNMMAFNNSAWKILNFNVTGNLSNYVNTIGQIQVQVVSSNSAGNCNIDYEALTITTNSSLPPVGQYFYVSTTGKDSNPGSITAPWRHIQHAANMIRAGNTVYVHGGVYNEQVSIPTSGTATGGYITFQSFPGETAIVDGTNLAPGVQTGLLDVQSKSYIRIIGFEIRNFKTATANVPAGINIGGAGSHIEVRRNLIHDIVTTAGGSNGNAFGIAVYGTNGIASINHLSIDGNELRNLQTGCSESLTINGNVQNWQVTNNSNHDNNNIGIDSIGFEKTAPANDQARDGLVAGNLVYNITSVHNPCYNGSTGANGIYSDGGTRIIIERNIVHHADIGIEMASEIPGHVTSHVIARNNLVYLSQVVGVSIGGANATMNGGTDHVTIVNNTLFKNDTGLTGSGEFQIQNHATNNLFENNLVYASSQALFVNDFTNSTPDPVAANYNLYWSSVPADSSSWFWQALSITGFGNPGWQQDSGQDKKSHYANPLLLNTSTPDLYDLLSSPANDAGTNLGPAVVGTVDQNGFPRVQGSNIDIGAFER
jgi:hypothetical protein